MGGEDEGLTMTTLPLPCNHDHTNHIRQHTASSRRRDENVDTEVGHAGGNEDAEDTGNETGLGKAPWEAQHSAADDGADKVEDGGR